MKKAFIISFKDTRTEREEEFVVFSETDARESFYKLKEQFETRYNFIETKDLPNGQEIRGYAEKSNMKKDKNRIGFASIKEVDVKRRIFPQTENLFVNDDDKTVIDAWPTTDEDDENGCSVAEIDTDGHVEYLEDESGEKIGRNCLNVFDIIEETITENIYGW